MVAELLGDPELGQQVRLPLRQGTASLWLLLKESTVLLLSMQAKPTSNQQATACACTCASFNRDSQPHPAMHGSFTQQSWLFGAVDLHVKAACGLLGGLNS